MELYSSPPVRWWHAPRAVRLLAGRSLGAALLLLALAAPRGAAGYHYGDFVHTARRSQFARMRTTWRDLTEHHCPRFGAHRTVALPVPAPKGVDGPVDDYRIQLSFDGERAITPWIPVVGGRAAAGMPLVVVHLRRVGGELKSARAEVHPVPDEFLVTHSSLVDEFNNASHWPKHVLVHYEFLASPSAALEPGLLVMLGAGLLTSLLVSINNLAGLQGKLRAFMQDALGDTGALDPLLPPSFLGGGASGFPAPYVPAGPQPRAGSGWGPAPMGGGGGAGGGIPGYGPPSGSGGAYGYSGYGAPPPPPGGGYGAPGYGAFVGGGPAGGLASRASGGGGLTAPAGGGGYGYAPPFKAGAHVD